MVAPIFVPWGMLKDNVLFVSTVIVATPCLGFEAQHSLISSLFADTLLLIVTHGHMRKFLVVGKEFTSQKNNLDTRTFLGIF